MQVLRKVLHWPPRQKAVRREPLNEGRRATFRAIGGALIGTVPLVAPIGSALAAPNLSTQDAQGVRKVNLVHAATGEHFNGVYFYDGQYVPEVLEDIDWLLRDFHLDEARSMDIALYDLMAHVAEHLNGRELIVTSGYRTRRTNDALRRRSAYAAKNSLHIAGKAVDFYAPGVSGVKLARLCARARMGGVGSYRGHRFVHADVGRVRYWRR